MPSAQNWKPRIQVASQNLVLGLGVRLYLPESVFWYGHKLRLSSKPASWRDGGNGDPRQMCASADSVNKTIISFLPIGKSIQISSPKLLLPRGCVNRVLVGGGHVAAQWRVPAIS